MNIQEECKLLYKYYKIWFSKYVLSTFDNYTLIYL